MNKMQSHEKFKVGTFPPPKSQPNRFSSTQGAPQGNELNHIPKLGLSN